MLKRLFFIISIGLLIFIGSYWLFVNSFSKQINPEIFTTHTEGKRHFYVREDGEKVYFDLIDPESAPPEIFKQVMHGYRIVIETPAYASNYVGDKLTCSNCHFLGGNTLGGENGGISLVGVTAVYPRYSKEEGRKISLKERINKCFMLSMNGKPIPEDSSLMNDVVTYLTWISQEVVHEESFPWLGLPQIKSKHVPNASEGEKVYQKHCSICHEPNGEGAPGIPPVWGADSYNDAAGMHNIQKFASFVWENMPYQQPILTLEEALDVAAYVSSRPRPHFSNTLNEVVPNNH